MSQSFTSIADGDWNTPAVWHAVYNLTDINTVSNYFQIAGDHASKFAAGNEVLVTGYSAGSYTVVSSVYTTVTKITVSEAIVPPYLVNGTIQNVSIPSIPGDDVTVANTLTLDDDIDIDSLTIDGSLTVNNNHYIICPVILVETAGVLQGDGTNNIKIKGSLTVNASFLGQSGDSFYLGESTFIDATILGTLYLNGDADFDADTLGNSTLHLKIMSPNITADLDGQIISYAGATGCVYTMGLGL